MDGRSNGIGFFGLLAIVLVVLKLCGVVGWSWWAVLFPVWLPAVILAAMIVLIIIKKDTDG